MPIYEFTCAACHTRFEKLTKRISDERPMCPHCGSAKTSRALSAFAVGSEVPRTSPPTGCGRCGGPGPCGMD